MDPDRRHAEPRRDVFRPAVVADEKRSAEQHGRQVGERDFADERCDLLWMPQPPDDTIGDLLLAGGADQHDPRTVGLDQMVDQRGKVFDRPLLHVVASGRVHANERRTRRSAEPQLARQRRRRRGGDQGTVVAVAGRGDRIDQIDKASAV